MIKLLIRLFIKDSENVSDPDVREAYGTLSGIMGIALNAVLFIAKYIAGTLAGSIAIIADAFNNLSDAGSSLITLFGFRLAGRKPHSDHPFGHGRYEYIAGLVVSLLIIMMGFSLAKDSFLKILNPEPVDFSIISAVILCASIAVKLYMCVYNRALSRKIDSVAMKATATDSLSDAIATSVVLISMIVGRYTGLAIDGYTGVLVALMILWAGVSAAKDTISPLLGTAPDKEFVNRVYSIVRSCPLVRGVHDLVIHDYGAGRRMISLHAEVPADGDIMATHDAIDLIERRLCHELSCHAVIHMDPLETNDELVNATRQKIIDAIHKSMDMGITLHDFRMVSGPTHTNVIFDVLLPYDSGIDTAEAKKRICKIVTEVDPNYNAVVTIDTSFV